MQNFFDYLGTLIIVPIATVVVIMLVNLLIAFPGILKIGLFIASVVFVIYLVPYFLRAFVWSLIPGWYLAEFIQKYELIPALVNRNGQAPLIDTIVLCIFCLTALILLIFRSGWIKEDRMTNDPCVPFVRNRYQNEEIPIEETMYPNAEPVMAKKKNPIGFIWDED